ncbi:hypothetical protein OFB97_33180, partial [Escherichia coli]|nr:hypothetical protein [Escherichia coli]
IRMSYPDGDLQLPDDRESDDGREKSIALGSLLRRHSVMHVLLHDLQVGILSERECLENLQVMLAESADQARRGLQSILA